MINQPRLRQIPFFNVIFKPASENICATYVSAVKLHPFLLSRSHLSSSVQLCFERVVIFNVIVWFHRTSPPSPLKRGRADRSWVIPAVSPSLGKTWVSSTTRTLPSPSYPSTFFLLLHATGTNLCQLNRFSGHFWGAHKAASLLKLTWGYLSWLRPLENKQEDRGA